MSTDPTAKTWNDPYALVKEATSQREIEHVPASPGASTVEDAIRRAHQLVSPDFYVIERLKQANMEPDYFSLFGEQIHEKLAALIFLTKHKLLDIEQSTLSSRDVGDARRDLSMYVEILFRVQAVEALGIFYDFAAAQRDSRVPWLWHNVCARCLYLMALLTDCLAKVAAFLDDRPNARRQMQELISSTKPDVATPLQQLETEYSQLIKGASTIHQPSSPAPLYVALVQQYESRATTSVERDTAARGVSSLLTAQDRIQQAASAGDTTSLADWISHGSPAAMHTAFRCALAAMPVTQYIAMLEQTLEHGGLEPVRMTSVVLELGSVNRTAHPQGGMPTVNRLLQRIALSTKDEFNGVAKVAVHELGEVKALLDLQVVLEKAPLLAVAEEVMQVMRDLRHLPMVESLLNQRPELIPAFRSARRELLELQQLVESAWACQSEEMAMIYLDQLKAMKAIPELKQLAMGSDLVSDMAQQMVVELQTDIPWARE